MAINGINASFGYQAANAESLEADGSGRVGRAGTLGFGAAGPLDGKESLSTEDFPIEGDDEDKDGRRKAGRKSSPEECETCKRRKYKDGSNENVSFKSATHVSPEAAGAAVRAHEGEHVSNAYAKAAENDGKVVSASVTIHTGICPECGRVYVSGGTTNTMILYPNESNPYQKERKSQDEEKLAGNNFDTVA